MDYPLGDQALKEYAKRLCGLNPYSNGLPSRGHEKHHDQAGRSKVLIPILMDYPLGGEKDIPWLNEKLVLIPILMDYPLGDKNVKFFEGFG